MLIFNKYTFNCRWQTEAEIPFFWGSVLRGALGRELRRVSCVLRTKSCSNCPIFNGCAYGYIFESDIIKELPGRGPVNARPHPFIFEPPFPPPKSTRKDDSFVFSITLIGKADEYLPHVAYSLIKAGEFGIGKGLKSGLGRFRLETICTSDGQMLFDWRDGELKRASKSRQLSLSENREVGADKMQIEVRYLTPFRVKANGKYSRNVPFHILIRSALRRISSLEAAYYGQEPKLDYKGLVERAQHVKTVKEELKWLDLPRFSYRQRRWMTIGGPVGTVVYEGELAEFLPILYYVQEVNAGKQTSFGLGRIEIKKL